MSKRVLIIISLAFVATASFLAVIFWPKKISEMKIQPDTPVGTEENNNSETENVETVNEPENREEVSNEPAGTKSEEAENKIEASTRLPARQVEASKKEPEGVTAAFKINSKLVNWGFQKASGRAIDTIIIHSTYNALGGDPFDFDKILDIYKSYEVAPHYIITREGKVYQLVEDKNIAYHAGVSRTPDGRNNVNNFSIGIEIINSKTEGPSKAQYENLKRLIAKLKADYEIKYVLGHSDVASGRKDDPWKFDWKKVK